MYGNYSHSEGTCVLLEIPSMYTLDIFRVCTGMRINMSLKVYILPTLKLIFFQAVLNIVVSNVNGYQLMFL